MHWRYKALTQKLFSGVPGGERLNYLAQRFVTRTLTLTTPDVKAAVRQVGEFRRILDRHGLGLDETRVFEFGAGWFLLKQLLLALYGCRSQITVDLRPLASIRLINEAVEHLTRSEKVLGRLRRVLRPVRSFEDLQRHYGIEYRAPFDARACNLPDGSVDLVSSTATLEHIPPGDIRAIMRESRRILRAGGLAVHYVDYTDHFAHSDRGISVYNFLRFSTGQWRRYNSFIHYQNRLRHVQYRTLFDEEGFDLLEECPDSAGPADLLELQRLQVSDEFAGFSQEQLSVRGALFVLRPRPRDAG